MTDDPRTPRVNAKRNRVIGLTVPTHHRCAALSPILRARIRDLSEAAAMWALDQELPHELGFGPEETAVDVSEWNALTLKLERRITEVIEEEERHG